ncbi:UbiA family prenyltransferase [Xanthocytophaga agilis]|uniref:UbiA family prenyltransferase n=1 Tax=Xanthocytophaga agilis TaxID=3048010 RepID=A0AAE3QWH6_9BACT|nr:UbiA family prenyltransferase [Xanthocytophaga agilis]MDJ1499331.1 UbiA family prenyltransferase [Xanthocytophaga agilis]
MKSSRFFAYLQLMRPANIVTAMADILAGVAVAWFSLFSSEYGNIGEFIGVKIKTEGPASGVFQSIAEKYWKEFFVLEMNYLSILFLLLSTIGLYGGGVVFNDVFDAKLDAVERPERSIPSGRASLRGATILGSVLLIFGIGFAFLVSPLSGVVAILTAFCALLYNKIGKHQSWGPLNMGLCRGLNLFLGTTIFYPFLLSFFQFENYLKEENILIESSSIISGLQINTPSVDKWYICLIPIIYISAITSVSRGEVHGGSKRSFYIPFFLYGIVILSICVLAFISGTPLWQSLPFLVFFIYLIFPPLIRAYNDPQPRNIGLAVKAGVISLIVMDASIAAVFAGGIYGLIVLVLLPLSRFLAKYFAVT